MKRKTLCLFIAVVMIIACTACSSTTPPSEPSNSQNAGGNTSTPSQDNGTPTTDDNNPAPPAGRVTNVISPDFTLTDGFIVPVERQTTVPDGYIGISTAEEFNKIRLNSSANYILMDDIDLSSLAEWKYVDTIKPFRDYDGIIELTVPVHETPLDFEGVLDGNGFTVSGFETRLFEEIETAEIRNLAVELNGRNMIRASTDSTIYNCYTFGTVNYSADEILIYANGAHTTIGAMIGKADRTEIANCYNTADIAIDYEFTDKNSAVTNLTPVSGFGGLVGIIRDCTVTNSYNSGDISISVGAKNFSAGGIAGSAYNRETSPAKTNATTISGCYNAGNIVTNGNAAGIFANGAGTSTENCYNVGTIESKQGHAGGIGAGNNIFNSYNAGSIIGGDLDDSNAVGIGYQRNVVVSSCYSIGQIKGEIICGISPSKDLDYCYFLDNVENATPDGALFANVKKLTKSEMKLQSSFAGFDFDTIWEMGADHPVFMDVYE